jgi:hypothetical protein
MSYWSSERLIGDLKTFFKKLYNSPTIVIKLQESILTRASPIISVKIVVKMDNLEFNAHKTVKTDNK